MRLIDADNIRVPDDERYKGTLRRLIIQQPTIDAEPVVRCKDCKFCYGDNYEGYYCDLGNFNDTPGLLDFCSYGERKKEDVCD